MSDGGKVISFLDAAGFSAAERERRQKLWDQLDREDAKRRAAEAAEPESTRELRKAINELEGLMYTVERAAEDRGLLHAEEVQHALHSMRSLIKAHTDANALRLEMEPWERWAFAFFDPQGPKPAAAIALPRPR